MQDRHFIRSIIYLTARAVLPSLSQSWHAHSSTDQQCMVLCFKSLRFLSILCPLRMSHSRALVGQVCLARAGADGLLHGGTSAMQASVCTGWLEANRDTLTVTIMYQQESTWMASSLPR
jgi:hypothetical protein